MPVVPVLMNKKEGGVDLDTEVQLCVIHQIRNSIKYVASKHHNAFMADLKPVYRAVSKEAAEMGLSVVLLPIFGYAPQGAYSDDSGQ